MSTFNNFSGKLDKEGIHPQENILGFFVAEA
jgi:hypothetical protein